MPCAGCRCGCFMGRGKDAFRDGSFGTIGREREKAATASLPMPVVLILVLQFSKDEMRLCFVSFLCKTLSTANTVGLPIYSASPLADLKM